MREKRAQPRCSKGDVSRAKSLRRSSPLVERLLWNALQENHKNEPFHFRRQHPLPPYIVDFVCVKAKIIIEIDGQSHDMRLDQDAHRDAFLSQKGYMTLRFTNEDVLTNLEGVVAKILDRTRSRLG